MSKAFIKQIFRTIVRTRNRYMAIFAITVLGVGFLTGLLCTGPDMKNSVDRYYDAQNFMDIDIKSTMGLTDEDLEEVRSMEGVDHVTPLYQEDRVLNDASGETKTVRITALDLKKLNEDDVNLTTLVAGRLPETEDECVQVLIGPFNDSGKVGDKIEMEPLEDPDEENFKLKEFKIVGLVSVPLSMSIETEPTSVGSGSISEYYYVLPEAVDTDVYTDFYVTLGDAKALDTFSDKYQDLIDEKTDSLKKLGDDREKARYDSIINEANKEIKEGEDEYKDERAKAEKELADAEKELTDAEAEIADGEKALADALAELDKGWDELGRSESELANAKAKLDDAKAQLDANAPKIAEARKALEETPAKIEEAKKSVADYEAALKEYETGKAALDEAIAQYEAGEAAYEEAYAAYEAGLITEEEITAMRAALDQAKAEIDANQAALDAAKAQLDQAAPQIEEARNAIASWDKTYPELVSAIAQYEAAEKAYQDGLTEYQNGAAAIESGRAKLNQGETGYAENYNKLQDAKAELADGRADYEKAKKEAYDKFDEAEAEIADARKKLDDIEYPEWYVLDRTSNPSYYSFVGNADKVTAISKVFPVFFFLVAALVALTTMTRMVDEERTEIGTMKALGYRSRTITSKYIFYAGTAGLFGSIAGILIGQWIFPTVIWNAYGIMYYYPGFKTEFIPIFALPSAAAAIISVLLATWWAVYDNLKEKPATLMLPKAPKAGKRILLEYIKPVWSHLTFTWKVTMRNLFRYKKRFFMTIVGIAGCTALLLTGFGIRDSIGHIVENQFSEIQTYDLTVHVNDDMTDDSREILKKYFSDKDEAFTGVFTENGKARKGRAKESVSLEVPTDIDSFKDFVLLRDRVTREPVEFDENSVVLAEKLADNLGVEPGDTFTYENNDGKQADLKVTGITENYIFGYVYVGENAWKEAYGEAPDANTYFVKSTTEEGQTSKRLTEILKIDGVRTAQFSGSVIETFSNMLNKIDYIVIVLIISAGLLAFVVLYNLTYINISERQKEIATIKVLGFYRGEVNKYIYRETLLLSIFGILIGLVLGIWLHKFVIVTVEVTEVMFGREILPLSFVYAAAITLIFTGLVCLALAPRLRKISMVESLKSVD
ncbi:MAG: FtsX-like permease family protein [Firmicutes bacterium]|nr:FtsX-like permease family protein [Bacillota bacterium]